MTRIVVANQRHLLSLGRRKILRNAQQTEGSWKMVMTQREQGFNFVVADGSNTPRPLNALGCKRLPHQFQISSRID